jgi:hypothetical protein
MTKTIAVTGTHRFTVRFYFQAVAGVIGSPRRFFKELPDPVGLRRAFGFLLVSGLFFTGASLLYIQEQHALIGGIFLANALFMPFIAAAVSYMVMIMTLGRRVAFERLFAVYAFAAGVTLLVSWIPLSLWFTEPWRWVLVGMGMVKGCGLGWRQAILIIGVSIVILILFFWSLAPLMPHLRGLMGQTAS